MQLTVTVYPGLAGTMVGTGKTVATRWMLTPVHSSRSRRDGYKLCSHNKVRCCDKDAWVL